MVVLWQNQSVSRIDKALARKSSNPEMGQTLIFHHKILPMTPFKNYTQPQSWQLRTRRGSIYIAVATMLGAQFNCSPVRSTVGPEDTQATRYGYWNQMNDSLYTVYGDYRLDLYFRILEDIPWDELPGVRQPANRRLVARTDMTPIHIHTGYFHHNARVGRTG
jgi:hypothetical protein